MGNLSLWMKFRKKGTVIYEDKIKNLWKNITKISFIINIINMKMNLDFSESALRLELKRT